jgi:signal transduction histidine kinase
VHRGALAGNATSVVRRLPSFPLFWKLLAPYSALVLVAGIAGTYALARDERARAEVAHERMLTQEALAVRSRLHEAELSLLEAASLAAHLEGMTDALAAGDRASANALLGSVLALKPEVVLAVVLDQQGTAVTGLGRDGAGIIDSGAPPVPVGALEQLGPPVPRAPRAQLVEFPSGNAALAVSAPICADTSPSAGAADTCAPIGSAVVVTPLTAALAVSQPDDATAARLYDPAGRPLGGTSGLGRAPSVDDAATRAVRSEVDGRAVSTLYAPLSMQGRRVGTLAVVLPRDSVDAAVRRTVWRTVLAVIVLMAATVAVGALVSRSILRQVRRLLDTHRRLGAGDLSARAEVAGTDELAELAAGVNQMATRVLAARETLEARVVERTEEVERLMRERSQFFAQLSHELRTPLAIIRTQADLLDASSRRWSAAGRRRTAATLHASADQLLGLVEQILELARAETGRLDLRSERVSLDEVIRDLEPTFEGLAGAADVALTVDCDVVPCVDGDERRLRQIVLNLVDNAIKYTPAGGRVEISLRASEDDVVLSVADTGVGIPVEAGERIFDPFFRVEHPGPQRGEPSSGLGLAVAERLATAHGGGITYAPRPDGGTTFAVTIPHQREPAMTGADDGH